MRDELLVCQAVTEWGLCCSARLLLDIGTGGVKPGMGIVAAPWPDCGGEEERESGRRESVSSIERERNGKKSGAGRG